MKAGEAEDPSVPGTTELRVSIVRSLTDSARGHLAKARVDDALRDLQAADSRLAQIKARCDEKRVPMIVIPAS